METLNRLQGYKKNIFIVFFFIVIINIIFSPIASNKYVPTTEFSLHSKAINQAKIALEEGQFPIRTAPLADANWGNAFYQFYAPFPYMVAATIQKSVAHRNPYLALKITLALSILLGAIYFYRIIISLIPSEKIAILASTLYFLSPYFLVNVLARGDFTEAVAQGILPITLYYILRLYYSKQFNINTFFLVAITSLFLAMTHIVTFVYFSLFAALLLIIVTFKSMQWHSFKKISYVGSAYILTCLLGLYYFAPMALFTKYFSMNNSFDNFEIARWITLLPALFSPTSVSPMPLPGNGLAGPNINISMGIILVFAIGGIVYSFIFEKSAEKKLHPLTAPFFIIFALAFFASWTPINFWNYLPKILRIAQFNYRLLAQVMWIGAILFAFYISYLFNDKLTIKQALSILFVIIISSNTWIVEQHSEGAVRNIIEAPDLGYGQYGYLVSYVTVDLKTNPHTIPVSTIKKYCKKVNTKTICQISIKKNNSLVQLPILYYPAMLNITVNGHKTNYVPTKYDIPPTGIFTLASLNLAPGNYTIESEFKGLAWANGISLLAWLMLILIMLTHPITRLYHKFFSET